MSDGAKRSGIEWLAMLYGALVALACAGYLVLAVVFLTDTTGAPPTSTERVAAVLFAVSSVALAATSFATSLGVAMRRVGAKTLAYACAALTSGHHLFACALVGAQYLALMRVPTGGTSDVLLVPVDIVLGLGGLVIAGIPFAVGFIHVVLLVAYVRAPRAA
jgi:hypothetical protein